MIYSSDELENNPSNFQKLRIGVISKRTSYKERKKSLLKQSLEIQFGINLKQYNQFKTKQLKLF